MADVDRTGSDGLGLNKELRQFQERRAEEEAYVVPPLDPPFPYTIEVFSSEFFGLPAEPDELVRGA